MHLCHSLQCGSAGLSADWSLLNDTLSSLASLALFPLLLETLFSADSESVIRLLDAPFEQVPTDNSKFLSLLVIFGVPEHEYTTTTGMAIHKCYAW